MIHLILEIVAFVIGWQAQIFLIESFIHDVQSCTSLLLLFNICILTKNMLELSALAIIPEAA